MGNLFPPDRQAPCRDDNPVLRGSVFGCATGRGKDDTSGETAAEGTAVDTGDSASNAATDILAVFAREARTYLAP